MTPIVGSLILKLVCSHGQRQQYYFGKSISIVKMPSVSTIYFVLFRWRNRAEIIMIIATSRASCYIVIFILFCRGKIVSVSVLSGNATSRGDLTYILTDAIIWPFRGWFRFENRGHAWHRNDARFAISSYFAATKWRGFHYFAGSQFWWAKFHCAWRCPFIQ